MQYFLFSLIGVESKGVKIIADTSVLLNVQARFGCKHFTDISSIDHKIPVS